MPSWSYPFSPQIGHIICERPLPKKKLKRIDWCFVSIQIDTFLVTPVMQLVYRGENEFEKISFLECFVCTQIAIFRCITQIINAGRKMQYKIQAQIATNFM